MSLRQMFFEWLRRKLEPRSSPEITPDAQTSTFERTEPGSEFDEWTQLDSIELRVSNALEGVSVNNSLRMPIMNALHTAELQEFVYLMLTEIEENRLSKLKGLAIIEYFVRAVDIGDSSQVQKWLKIGSVYFTNEPRKPNHPLAPNFIYDDAFSEKRDSA